MRALRRPFFRDSGVLWHRRGGGGNGCSGRQHALEEEEAGLRSSTGSVWCLRNGWVAGGGSDRNASGATLVADTVSAEGRAGDARTGDEGKHMQRSLDDSGISLGVALPLQI